MGPILLDWCCRHHVGRLQQAESRGGTLGEAQIEAGGEGGGDPTTCTASTAKGEPPGAPPKNTDTAIQARRETDREEQPKINK